MARRNDPADFKKVAEMLPPKGSVRVGKPQKILTAAQRSKMAFPSVTTTNTGAGGNFYSPELSTDFLELPQTLDEQRNFYRFFYDHEPFVAQAIDLHPELPLSKVRLSIPRAKDRELAEKSLHWCEKWANRVKLLQRLVEITHEYNLIGDVAVFCEDASPEMPRELWEEPVREVTAEGELLEKWVARPEEEATERALGWLKKNYKGWTAIRILPPEQLKVEAFPFTDEKLIELVPDSKTRAIIQKAQQGDENAIRIVKSMPADVVDNIQQGQNIPLNMNPDAGSFVFMLSRKKSP